MYAYLRRLGYVVTRTEPPSSAYPVAAPFNVSAVPRSSVWARCFTALLSPFRSLLTMLERRDWWSPIYLSRWLHHDLSYRKFTACRPFYFGLKTCFRSISLPLSSVPVLWKQRASSRQETRGELAVPSILQPLQAFNALQKDVPSSAGLFCGSGEVCPLSSLLGSRH